LGGVASIFFRAAAARRSASLGERLSSLMRGSLL
jgi:hypothetical protein